MSSSAPSNLSLPDPLAPAAAQPRPMFPPLHEVLPSPGTAWSLPDDQELDARQFVRSTRAYADGVARGTIFARNWADLAKLIRADTQARNPYRMRWLLGHTAAVVSLLAIPQPDAQSSWDELWAGTVPGPWGHDYFTDALSPMTIQVMTAAALKYGYAYPLASAPYVSAINKAAAIFLGCLMPLRAEPWMAVDLAIPPEQIPGVRAWLLDSLEKVDYPYADNNHQEQRSDRSHLQRRPLYVVGLPGEALPPAPPLGTRPSSDPPPAVSLRVPRSELAWALDNAVAVRFKLWARSSVICLDNTNQTKDLLRRLTFWSSGAAALGRTKGLLGRWPNPTAAYLAKETMDADTISSLVCALTTVAGWPSLARQSSLVPRADLVEWLSRQNASGTGPGDVQKLFAEATPSQRDLLIASVGPLVGLNPLPGVQGQTLAHLLMGLYPQVGVIRHIARAVGPAAFGVKDDIGRTPLDIARSVLLRRQREHRRNNGFSKGSIAPQIAILERVVLSSIKKSGMGVVGPAAPCTRTPSPSLRKM